MEDFAVLVKVVLYSIQKQAQYIMLLSITALFVFYSQLKVLGLGNLRQWPETRERLTYY